MTTRRALRCLALSISCLAFVLGGFAGCGGGDDSTPLPGADAGRDATTDAASCPASQTACGVTCVDEQTDSRNCGACGVVCTGGDTCEQGQCVIACLSGQAACGGRCVALETDNVNCGSCGNTCAAGQVCSNGVCALTCALPLTTCVASEIGDAGTGDAGPVDAATGDAATDAGADAAGDAAVDAGVDAATDPGDASAADASAADASSPTPPTPPTPARYCASTASDESNCGACGVTCAQGQHCSQGSCSPTCSIGETLCTVGSASSCRDLATDLANCGACGTTCAAGQVCSGGVCQANCGLPFTRCGNVCSNLATDPDDCGACGTICVPANVRAPACSSGACTSVGCQKGFSDCDGNAANGCELPTSADPKNCGGCGLQCSAVHVLASVCTGGSCGYSACQPGWGDCDGNVANGCEADLTTAATCGSCTQACTGATTTCSPVAGALTCTAGTTSYISPDFGATVTLPESLTWTIATAAPSAIFYTLDGSTPTTASAHGESPLVLTNVASTDGSTTVLKWISFDGTGTSAVQTRTIATSSAARNEQSWVIPTNVSFVTGTSSGPFLPQVYTGGEVDLTVDLQVSNDCATAGGCTGFGDLVYGVTPSGCEPVTPAAWPGTSTTASLTFYAPETPGTYAVQMSSGNSQCAGEPGFTDNTVLVGWVTVTLPPG